MWLNRRQLFIFTHVMTQHLAPCPVSAHACIFITAVMLEQYRSGQKYTDRPMSQLPDLLCGLQLDFSIVVVSVVVLALDALLPSVQWLKGLRVLRALKPLRS